MEFDDEIVSIEYVGEQMLMDIEVSGDHLFYANGILTHNSSVEASEFDHSHIAGGISKINTADTVFGIFTSQSMRESGKYQLQFLKSRSSSAVGSKIELKYDPVTLIISDMDNDGQTELAPQTAASLRSSINGKVSSTFIDNGEVADSETGEIIAKDAIRDLINRNRNAR